MKFHKSRPFVALAALFLCCSQAAQAHFLWLTSLEEDGQTKAVLYFNESAHEQDYHLPEAMVNAKVSQRFGDKETNELSMTRVETDDRVGLESKLENADSSILATQCDYGIYGGALLSYYTKHIRSSDLSDLGAAGQVKKLKLEIVPRVIDGQMELSVLWEGKPKAKVDLTVTEVDDKARSLKTDAQGRARYVPTSTGLVGVMAGFTDRSAKGEVGGKAYTGASHYATLTFQVPTLNGFKTNMDEKDSLPAEDEAASSEFPVLPEALASFGAAVHDGWLYVYGGHIGGAHDHSRDNLSPRFQRLKLDGGQVWEQLPMQTHVQGLALVADETGLYRIGGLNARNADGEDEDLHSTAEFSRFDPSTLQWTKLADLPAARSSHDAVVIGDKLYVAGGWTLEGASPGTWLDHGLVFDLTNLAGGWTALPKSPFNRRALAVSHWLGKLIVMGGIDTEGDISFDTNVFDPQTQTWSQGPKLPGQGVDAFGISAWNLNGQLYFSGLEGQVRRLSADGQTWQPAAEMQTPRFFHQLLPRDDSSLIAVAGASSSGHVADSESVRVEVAAGQ